MNTYIQINKEVLNMSDSIANTYSDKKDVYDDKMDSKADRDQSDKGGINDNRR